MVKNLASKGFNATVLPDKDPKNQGRYRVNIPDLEPLLPKDTAIWVKNHIHKYRDTTATGFRYGQYFPIQPGTRVLVKFYNPNDINSGYIDRILDDDIPDPDDSPELSKYKSVLPFNAKKEDRDEIYEIIRTPRLDCLFLINEETTSRTLPHRSIHLYYKKHESYFIIDEEGFHFKTDYNEYHTVSQDYSLQVDDNLFFSVRNNYNGRVGGEYRLGIHYDGHIRSLKGNMYIESDNNALFLIAPNTDGGQIHSIAAEYNSMNAPNGYSIITGKEGIRQCSDKEIFLIGGSAVRVLAGKHVEILSVGNISLRAGGVVSVEASHLMVGGDMTVNGKITGLITHACVAAREGECPKPPPPPDYEWDDRFRKFYEAIDPIIFHELEDNFLTDYELENYMTLPDEDQMKSEKEKSCRYLLSEAYHKTHIPAVEEVKIQKDGQEFIKYFSKFKYDEIKEQQVQNKQADHLNNIRALMAQEGKPPLPNTVEFETSQ